MIFDFPRISNIILRKTMGNGKKHDSHLLVKCFLDFSFFNTLEAKNIKLNLIF